MVYTILLRLDLDLLLLIVWWFVMFALCWILGTNVYTCGVLFVAAFVFVLLFCLN